MQHSYVKLIFKYLLVLFIRVQYFKKKSKQNAKFYAPELSFQPFLYKIIRKAKNGIKFLVQNEKITKLLSKNIFK